MSLAPRFAMIGNTELNGIFRGRSVPAEALDRVLSQGLPWVPTNVTLSPSNTIPPDNPYGPMGETTLVPDPNARVVLPPSDTRPAMAVYLADIRHHDGRLWPSCARTQLKRALGALGEAGFSLQVGFEQECYIKGLADRPTAAFSLAGCRAVTGLAARVLDTLASAGTRLDQFVKEFGEDQYEIAAPVRSAVRAADEAVIAREVIRDAAALMGAHATFAPKPDLSQPGSGVHIHMSLWDHKGTPHTARNGALSPAAGAFVSGILDNLDAVMAYTTPSPNSFERLRPSSWVGVFKCFGVRNREAAIRLCPRAPGPEGTHPGASIEFRVADGAANPYLALAALVRAGIMGLSARSEAPESVEKDPAHIDEAEREARGIAPLTPTLADALGAAESLVEEWFGAEFWSVYSAVRRNEIADAEAAGDAYPAQLARIV